MSLPQKELDGQEPVVALAVTSEFLRARAGRGIE
jgi:hypothetical protein